MIYDIVEVIQMLFFITRQCSDLRYCVFVYSDLFCLSDLFEISGATHVNRIILIRLNWVSSISALLISELRKKSRLNNVLITLRIPTTILMDQSHPRDRSRNQFACEQFLDRGKKKILTN